MVIFMILHIVRMNEKLSDILSNYNVTLDDLVLENGHISDFNNIIPGTILKISEINENSLQILDNTEPLAIHKEIEPSMFNVKESENVIKNTPRTPGIRYVKYNGKRPPWFLKK